MHAKMAARSTCSCNARWPRAKPRRNITRLRGPRPPKAKATSRCHRARRMAGAPVYIVPSSCNDALKRCARRATADCPPMRKTCPQYLHLSLENMDVRALKREVRVHSSAPRKMESGKTLARTGARHACKSSLPSHCPFCFRSKGDGQNDSRRFQMAVPASNIVSGLIYSGGVHGGKFSATPFRAAHLHGSRETFSACTREGTVAVGSDADLVIFDPNAEQDESARRRITCAWTTPCSKEFAVKGVTRTVLSRGRRNHRWRKLRAGGRR